MTAWRASLLFSVLLSSVAGCVALTARHVTARSDHVEQAGVEIADDQLLDVWIELFDPGKLPDDREGSMGLSMDIRRAEARFMPVHLRRTMERTGFWGAVRVVPRGTEGAEVAVSGSILKSDGETLLLHITAVDASGRQWFSEAYTYTAKLADYQQSGPEHTEPFQPLYNAIANDLARYRASLDSADILTIRRLAALRFASDLAPDAFAGYFHRDENGRYTLVRLPAREDPMFQRILRLRQRDFMLIDTLSAHLDNFYSEMQPNYDKWREMRREESVALHRIHGEANRRKLLGLGAIAAAIGVAVLGGSNAATHTLGNVMAAGGVLAIKSGFDKESETEIHKAAIEELGSSFTSDARPLVVEVDGKTHELTGSAELQYQKWRELLRSIYATETGVAPTGG